MKTKKRNKFVKGKMKQLVAWNGGSIPGDKTKGKKAVGKALGINQSYVYLLLKGDRAPGARLYRDICKLHSEFKAIMQQCRNKPNLG